VLNDYKYSNSAGEKYFYLKKDFYIPNHLIGLWNIKVIDKDEFLGILGKNYIYISLKFQNDNTFFEKLLDYIGKDYKKKKILLKLPIIPIDEQSHISFKAQEDLENVQLFYHLDDEGVLNEIFDDLKVITTKYQKYLYEIPFYSDIFGVKKPDIIEILKSLGKMPDFFTSIDDNVNLLVYIKNNYLGNNQKYIIELLVKNYQFISKTNYLFKHDCEEPNYWNNNTFIVTSKLYISEEYLNTNSCIEKIVNKYCTSQGKKKIDFISGKYLEFDKKSSKKDLKSLQKEWRDFFNELKINDDIKIQSEELKMGAYGSVKYFDDTTSIENIPFISSALFESAYSETTQEIHIKFSKFTKSDSVFFFKKIYDFVDDDTEEDYRRVCDFDRVFDYNDTMVPWIEAIQDNYPIFVAKGKYKIKDLYLEVDDDLLKYFQSLPQEYISKENPNIERIFSFKKKPSLRDVIDLVSHEKVKDFEDIKSIFRYIHFHYREQDVELSEIPILKNKKIKYISTDKLIWKNGKELKLHELETSYGSDFKEFFIEQIGIQETPTTEQYIEYLKLNSQNYIKIFHKFILHIEELLNGGHCPNIEEDKIFLVQKKLFYIDEIIFNDEGIKATVIPNLFNVNQKYQSIFEKIVDRYQVNRISDYSREIKTFNAEDNEEIQAVYIKLLNFTWDYIFSKNQKKFEELKNDKEFILETKNVTLGAEAEIVLKIDVNGKYIDVEQDIAIVDDTIYLSKFIDERKIGTEISKYIAKKVGIDFEKLERFYDKVYRMNDYSKDEYYEEERIEEPKDNDKFDVVFEKLLNAPADDQYYDSEEDTSNDIDELEDDSIDSDSAMIVNNTDSGDINSTEDTQFNESEKRPEVNNDKTICPECSVVVNRKNLKKHLCNVHQLNCEDNAGTINKNPIPLNDNDKNSNNPNTQPDLGNAIDKHEKNIDEKDENLDPTIVNDEDKYRKQVQEQFDNNLKKSNSLTKKNYSLRRVKVGKKETKEFLEKQYKGYCQICGFTFEQKNNKGKYFESFDWLSEKISKQKTNIIEAGSSLCLCSRCHSGLKYGDFEAKFLSKLKNIDLTKFTFNDFALTTNTIVENDKIPICYDFIEMDMYKIPIRLLNEEQNIFYTEEHFLHFYNMLTL